MSEIQPTSSARSGIRRAFVLGIITFLCNSIPAEDPPLEPIEAEAIQITSKDLGITVKENDGKIELYKGETLVKSVTLRKQGPVLQLLFVGRKDRGDEYIVVLKPNFLAVLTGKDGLILATRPVRVDTDEESTEYLLVATPGAITVKVGSNSFKYGVPGLQTITDEE